MCLWLWYFGKKGFYSRVIYRPAQFVSWGKADLCCGRWGSRTLLQCIMWLEKKDSSRCDKIRLGEDKTSDLSSCQAEGGRNGRKKNNSVQVEKFFSTTAVFGFGGFANWLLVGVLLVFSSSSLFILCLVILGMSKPTKLGPEFPALSTAA